MSSLVTIKLNKPQGVSWGFRLQGGKDFATPLCIQKVNMSSVAEKAGLSAGDAIVSIAGKDAHTLRHKEAQDTIVNAGNCFDLIIQRGMQTWKPNVAALSEPKSTPHGIVVTNTSLAATPKTSYNIGSGHNTSAAPFEEGPDSKKLVNSQFNTPINLYSEDSIAETLSAQAEVLGQGVLGINFKKYQKEEMALIESPTYKLLHGEEDDVPQRPRPGRQDQGSHPFQIDPVGQQKVGGPSIPTPASFPPQNISSVTGPTTAAASSSEMQPGENICFTCQRLIVGVFVRIKGKNLHAECFKCATCGSSLKNVGYYNINQKLYCDVHAKQAARQNPPAANVVPVTVQPGQTPPDGAMTSPQVRSSAPFQQSKVAAPAPSALFKPPVGGVKLPFTISSPVQNKSAPLPKSTPIASAPVVAANFQTSANPQAFGAPAGGANVRTHIPKKDAAPAMNFVQSFMQKPVAATPAANQGGIDTMPKPTALLGGITKLALIKDVGSGARGVQAPGQRSAPRRGRGVMNQASASRIPVCSNCQRQIRGPFVSALGKTWCPDHFICATETCRKAIIEMGFVEEQGRLYCEVCYESFLAPICGKCDKRVKGDCLNAVGKQFHPECFCCAYCGKVFGSGAFYLEDGLPYCEADWNDLFTTKCVGCSFPIEAGDRWVEALNSNYHSQCFKCSKCNKNLEGQSFFAKGGKPFCKAHAQRGF